MKPWIVCSYYTQNTFYKELADKFLSTLVCYNIPHHILSVPNQRDWYKNTNYKPTFLLDCLKKFPNQNIIWVDVDAEFKTYPELFDSLACDIAVFEFDQNIWYPHKKPRGIIELLSGTVYLQNSFVTREIVFQWKKECDNNQRVWDQKSLQKVVGSNYTKLPAEYCCIDIVMNRIANPVIVHYQASRKVRKDRSLLNRA